MTGEAQQQQQKLSHADTVDILSDYFGVPARLIPKRCRQLGPAMDGLTLTLDKYQMKLSVFIFLSLLFSTHTSVGQGKKNLDSDFGLAKFKLETSYSLFKADLEYFDTDKQGVEYYYYNKSDVKEIFGFPVEQIGLGFYDNKLYTISIGFGALDKKQNLTLLQYLKDKYDIPQITEPNNNERVWVAEWITGKTYFQATEYTCLSSINRCKTEVFMYSKSIKRQLPSD